MSNHRQFTSDLQEAALFAATNAGILITFQPSKQKRIASQKYVSLHNNKTRPGIFMDHPLSDFCLVCI